MVRLEFQLCDKQSDVVLSTDVRICKNLADAKKAIEYDISARGGLCNPETQYAFYEVTSVIYSPITHYYQKGNVIYNKIYYK